MSERSAAFELSTVLSEPEFFVVDGEPYKLLGIDHLSTAEEAKVMGYFARYSALAKAYDKAKSDRDGEKAAASMIDQRMKILTIMTDLPLEVAEKLPVSGQVKLMEYLGNMLPGDDDVDNEDSGDE